MRRSRTLLPHHHGTLTGYTNGCRCTPCTDEHTRRVRARRRRKAMGVQAPSDHAPFQPTHQSVVHMRSLGYTDSQLARLTGLANAHVNRLRKPGGKHVTVETAQRVADAVALLDRVPPRDLLAARYVDAHGAQLRIRALMTRGWGLDELGRRLGHSGGYLSPVLYTSRRVTPAVHQAIADLYDQLWQQRGPSSSTAKRSASRGWATPLELDDDRIDDPSYTPTLHRLDDVAERRQRREDIADRRRQVVELLDRGLTAADVARRLGITTDLVQVDRKRAAS